MNQPSLAKPYAEEAQQRWPEHYAESQKRVARLTKAQQQELAERENRITTELAALMNAGEGPDGERVQSLIAEHYRWICEFWTPNRDAYVGLGEMYVTDERFKARYEQFATGLAEFLRNAMRSYAFANLT